MTAVPRIELLRPVSPEQPHLYLDQKNVCLLSDSQGSEYARSKTNHGAPLDIEHLFPKQAIRQHRRLLRNIGERHENKVHLCKDCHHRRDHHPELGKMAIYRRFGLVGLVHDIALYPRAQDPELYVLQYHQWRHLFTMVDRRLEELIKAGKVSGFSMPAYTSSRDSIQYYLYRWEAGDFDIGSRDVLAILNQD